MNLIGVSSLVAIGFLSACSSNGTSTPSSGGTSSSSSTSSGGNTSSSGNTSTSGSAAGSCTGDISDCAAGTLSDAQVSDFCSTLLEAIDSPAGTKFECNDGPNSGTFLTVNTKDQCVSQRPPATCTVKVGQLIDCYKAAKADACASFADNGACAPLFSSTNGCTTK